MDAKEQGFCLLVLPSITRALYKIGAKNAALGFAAFKMLNDYAITAEKPENVDDDLTLSVLFETLAPIIDNGRNKAIAQRENGKKGGIAKRKKAEANTTEQTDPDPPEVITPEVINQEVINPEQITQYLQDVSKATNLTPERLNYYKGRFDAHCRASNKTHENFDDWKKHFYAWLNKVPRTQEEKETDKAKKRNADWQEYATKRLQDRPDPEDLPDFLKDL